MKIALVALNTKYVHSNLAVYVLEAYAKKHWASEQSGCECPQIVVREYTINQTQDQILQSVYREKVDVVAFSCYIWNMHQIECLAAALAKVSPRTKIWLGGPEVSYDPEAVLDRMPFVEGIMRGEGEATFYELVRCWAGQGVALEDILGITYRERIPELQQASIRVNPAREAISLDELPFIYEDLSHFENKILYYETSRGCPFSCSYCLSSIDKRVRFRSLSLVKQELQHFLDNRVTQVKLVDRTFNCNKKHALEIWRYLIRYDNGVTNFHFEIAADLLDEEALGVLQQMRPGQIQLEIGLQSTHPKTIQEIHRVMDVERVRHNIEKIRSFGNIHQHLDLIAGLPYEDMETFQRSFEEAFSMRPHQLQLGFLKVLKGSYMQEQAEAYALLYQDTQPYEVLSTRWMTYDALLVLKQVEQMVEVYYNSAQFVHVLEYLLSFYNRAYDFFESLGQYYEKHHLFEIGFRREVRYQALRDYALEQLQDVVKISVLDALLTYDFYLRENAKNRPVWSREAPIDKEMYQDFFRRGGTEECSLGGERYQSRVAAREMHIEPIPRAALPWIIRADEPLSRTQQTYYCLFDYHRRNPLTGDAAVVILSHL